MKLAFAAIVKGTDEEAELLGRCLSYVSEYVDGIFITITHKPGEAVNDKCVEVCRLFNAQVSTFEWVKDFAKARNFNFSQVPKEFDYILWCDADDAIRGMPKLRETMEQNPADAYSMFYMYAFDKERNPVIVHQKTRVVKNDGCVEWAGRIHEDFKENRQIKSYHIDGIEVLHLSNETRYGVAKDRNLEIAEQSLNDNPDDPREYYNYGNALSACGRYGEAIKAFDTFLKTSKSEDEKYIIRLRRSETFSRMGKINEAIEEAQYALGIKPNFPDAYFVLGDLLVSTGKFQKAAELFVTGLVKPRPYHQIIVYNPRDYDYVPMMKLANLYFQLSRPDLSLPLLKGCAEIYPNNENLKQTIKTIQKEVKKFDKILLLIKKLSKIEDLDKLRAELDKIPAQFKSHPGICNLRNIKLVKTESSGKDLIIYCGFTAEEWTPETIKAKGIGGSEEAVLHISNRLADLGWNVSVYNNCGHEVKTFGKVTYYPFWMWNYRDKQDVAIIWRTPMYCDYEINASKVYLDMHDVIPNAEFTESRLARITKVFLKSHYHRSVYPNIPEDKVLIIPNGIVPELFEETNRDLKLVINTSAPNRGIAGLTAMWPKIKAQVPDAKLQWAYGWSTFDAGYEGDVKASEWKTNLQAQMKAAGVEELGRVNHDQVAKLYLRANVFAYPTGFPEIDCISVTKAMAGGAIPVTTDFAALKEKQGFGTFVHTDHDQNIGTDLDCSITDPSEIQQTIEAIVYNLQNPPSEESRLEMRNQAKAKYAWDSIADKWNEELSR